MSHRLGNVAEASIPAVLPVASFGRRAVCMLRLLRLRRAAWLFLSLPPRFPRLVLRLLGMRLFLLFAVAAGLLADVCGDALTAPVRKVLDLHHGRWSCRRLFRWPCLAPPGASSAAVGQASGEKLPGTLTHTAPPVRRSTVGLPNSNAPTNVFLRGPAASGSLTNRLVAWFWDVCARRGP